MEKNSFANSLKTYHSPEEVIDKRISILREWSQEDSFFLTDYPYIHQKPRPSEKKQSIRIYLLLLGLLYWIQASKTEIIVLLRALFSTVENPFFSTQEQNFSSSNPY